MNYESLKTAIQSYVENEFTTTDINVFITQAEQRIYNTVQIAYLRKNVTGALTTSNQYLTLPTDWLDTFSLAVLDGSSNYSYLINKTLILYGKPTLRRGIIKDSHNIMRFLMIRH